MPLPYRHELLPELFTIRRGQTDTQTRDHPKRFLVLRRLPLGDGVQVLNDDGDTLLQHLDGIALGSEGGNNCSA